jgi:hypothetical protein
LLNPQNPVNPDSKPHAAAHSIDYTATNFLLNPQNPVNPDSKPHAAAHSRD